MAHELARDGIQCRLIDKAPHRAMESRAIAIHSRTVETFELMGFADALLSAGHRIAGVNVYGESGRIAHAAFGMLETRYPFVLGVPQDETERILEEHLARHGVRAAALGRRRRGHAAPSASLSGKRLCSLSRCPALDIRRYVDREGAVAKRYGSAPAAYLIRPDGYVGFRCDRRTVSANLPHYLAKILSADPG